MLLVNPILAQLKAVLIDDFLGALPVSSYRLFNQTYSQNKPITTMATINIVRSVLFISNTP